MEFLTFAPTRTEDDAHPDDVLNVHATPVWAQFPCNGFFVELQHPLVRIVIIGGGKLLGLLLLLLLLPSDLGVKGGQVELGIARRVGADLLESLEHVIRYRGLHRQMGTLRLEPVRVRIVGDPVQHTVRSGVRVLADRVRPVVARLLRRDAIARLVAVVVGPARFVVVLLRQYHRLRLGRPDQRHSQPLLRCCQGARHQRGQGNLGETDTNAKRWKWSEKVFEPPKALGYPNPRGHYTQQKY
uniref:Uncharacterized protein n=1 Tax=Anopheles atroparvus TaxID=41427 RepID=A0A182J8J3_ANOAO